MNNKKKLIISAIILIILALIGTSIFLGNPLLKASVEKKAYDYTEEKYNDLDLEIEKVYWNSKEHSYIVDVKSNNSKDTHFAIHYNCFGKLVYDYYHNDIEMKCNVADRINEEYGKIVKEYFEKSNLAYYDTVLTSVTCSESLELDKEYEIKEITKELGMINLKVKNTTESVTSISEILLDIKKNLDENNISFYSVSLDNMGISGFLYEDIYENDLESRVNNNLENM